MRNGCFLVSTLAISSATLPGVFEPTTLRTHTCGAPRKEQEGQTVTLCGWVHARRDHGGVRFIDLRDRYGLTQVVVKGGGKGEQGGGTTDLHDEDVVRVTGTVALRPEKLRNPHDHVVAIQDEMNCHQVLS